jgi:hypothetical protein
MNFLYDGLSSQMQHFWKIFELVMDADLSLFKLSIYFERHYSERLMLKGRQTHESH